MLFNAIDLCAGSASIHHAMQLMCCKSVTPHDDGCQSYLISQLAPLGFTCDVFTVNGVSNLIARWGQGNTHIGFSGHTDVVPPGPIAKWKTHPFEPQIVNNRLTGRGAADMKTGLAAMLSACEKTLSLLDPTKLSLWWLITSDEEGEAEYGSQWISQYLADQSIQLDGVIVGEPTSSQQTGDTIKIGRRGSLSASVQVSGKQGHVAYPQTCDNAIHKSSAMIQALLGYDWDQGTDDFPGSTCQITHLDTGPFVDNLAPGACTIEFNVRYSSQFNEYSLKHALKTLIYAIDPAAQISWARPCESFMTLPQQPGCLIGTIERAIFLNTGRYPTVSTSGGTSDGRFYAGPHTQVVEIGVPNTTIHQVNESIHVSDLLTLEDIYTDVLKGLGREREGG